jgi:chromosome segregation ATPase
MEIHQLRRRLARTEDGYREANDLAEELKRQLAVVEERAEQARRAMLDHAART